LLVCLSRRGPITCSFLFAALTTFAQSPSQSDTGPTSPTHLPPSGRTAQTGSVTATQSTANPGSGNSVDLINSSINVQGPYSGSTPNGRASGTLLELTLKDALARGLRFNLGAISQSQEVAQAESQRGIAKSSLLPNVSSAISEEVERLNLRTQGVLSNMFPLTAQFNFFDARAARLRQTVFDFVQLENLHSANENVAASKQSVRNARDLVVLAVGGAYLQITAAKARVAAAGAEVESARAIYQQAADRLSAGLDARIDVTRSQVELQSDEERLRSLRADLDTQRLRLGRLIGLPLGQQFDVIEEYPYSALSEWNVDSALAKAYQQRSDLQAATSSVRAAESAVKAAHAEHLPNLTLHADWGVAGLRPTAEAHSVYSVYGTLTIPIYEGGRIAADVQQAKSSLHQRQAEMEDVRGQVDQDVRQAFIYLNSAADQVSVAQSNVALSHDTLNQARDRFTAGVADTVELVQAEQAVVQADDDYINAVFEHNLAKISLARAMGNAEQNLSQLLKR
jgi:outer membrane protein TolC